MGLFQNQIRCGTIDATHVKASANKKKKRAQNRAHKYKRDLMIEINVDREVHGKKTLKMMMITKMAAVPLAVEKNKSRKVLVQKSWGNHRASLCRCQS